MCEAVWLHKWLDVFAGGCGISVSDGAREGGRGSQDVDTCAGALSSLSVPERTVPEVGSAAGFSVPDSLSAFRTLCTSVPHDSVLKAIDTPVRGVFMSGDEGMFLSCVEQFVSERAGVVSEIRRCCCGAGEGLKSRPVTDGVVPVLDELRREKSLLCDALAWTAWLRVRISNMGMISYDGEIDRDDLVNAQSVNEMTNNGDFYRQREKLRTTFIDTMQSHDMEKAAIREELRTLQMECELPLLQESVWRDVEELREIRAVAQHKLELCRVNIANDDDDNDGNTEEEGGCLSDIVRKEKRNLKLGHEEELCAIEKKNAALLYALEECQEKLRERRRRTCEGDGTSLLAQCSFAAARRDRLLREVRDLSEACERERIAHAALRSEQHCISTNMERVCRKRRLTMTEKAVAMDLLSEEYAQSSIATTLNAAMLCDITLRKSRSLSRLN